MCQRNSAKAQNGDSANEPTACYRDKCVCRNSKVRSKDSRTAEKARLPAQRVLHQRPKGAKACRRNMHCTAMRLAKRPFLDSPSRSWRSSLPARATSPAAPVATRCARPLTTNARRSPRSAPGSCFTWRPPNTRLGVLAGDTQKPRQPHRYLAEQCRNAVRPPVLNLASLAAGNVAATGGMAQLIGEKELPTLSHEGEKDSIHISVIGRLLLVVVFDERSSLGLVKLRSKQVSQQLASMFDEIASSDYDDLDSPFAGITDEDIDSLFS